MLRLSKKLACLALLLWSGQWSWGFALLGPINEPYQVPNIAYNPLPRDPLPIGPKNLGEEYRRNMPVLYYSYDANFLDYFGSSGAAAVDAAVAILNSITNASKLSAQLSEIPTQASRENYAAEALFLLDLKSLALHALVEQLGLAEPERYVWTLHDRYNIPGATCPAGMLYEVIQRNFDPVVTPGNQFQNSSYVNGTLYSYFIAEICQNGPPLAEALEFQVDPQDFSFTAVAALNDPFGLSVNSGLLTVGKYYTGLTRDDVGGLRYLLNPNNVNFESTGPNTLAAVTNPVPQLLFGSNLTLLASLALTNDPVTLQTLVPGLSVIASSNYFVNVYITNVTTYFTNYPWDPVGTGGRLAFATNLVPTIQTRYNHVFGNLQLLSQSSNGPALVPIIQIPPATNSEFITIQTDTIGTRGAPWATAGSTTIVTNSVFNTYVTNAVVGEYVILSTNLCAVSILSSQLTNVILATNFLGSVTNSLAVTNSSGFTNGGVTLFISFNQISYFTNHAFVILPVNCIASGAALFQGVDRIQFVRRDFDSLLGRFFDPTTNNYVLNSLTNNTLVPQPVLRTVLAPDILFSAADLANPDGTPPGAAAFGRLVNFNAGFINPGLAGPGTIEPSLGPTITFDKVGPIFLNGSPNAYFQSSAEANQATMLIFGSFDGTTNAPIVYPNGTSFANLENQVLMGISPGRLPNGEVGVDYGGGTTVLTATGGQPPYVWSLSPGSPALPPGLFLLSDGTLGGVPTLSGTFDFSVRLTDAGGRTVDRGYSITIIP